MFSLGPVTFVEPLAFISVPIIVIIWWFIKLKPPTPQRIPFPAIMFLKKLDQQHNVAETTPKWLKLLRTILITSVILGASHPLINSEKGFYNKGPIYLIIDDDWASAENWGEVQEAANKIIFRAQRDERLVAVITTAQRRKGSGEPEIKLLSPAEAGRLVKNLKPKPWFSSRQKQANFFVKSRTGLKRRPGDIFWLSNGLRTDNEVTEIVKSLMPIGAVTIFSFGFQLKGFKKIGFVLISFPVYG